MSTLEKASISRQDFLRWAGLFLLGGFAEGLVPAFADGSRLKASVPFQLLYNRVFVDMKLAGTPGKKVPATVWVDTGGGSIIVSQKLADAMGAKGYGFVTEEHGAKLLPFNLQALSLGDIPLKFNGLPTWINQDKEYMNSGARSDALLPGRFLKQYKVIVDYLTRTFTLADPSVELAFDGVSVPCSIQQGTGFPRIEVSIGGKSYGMLLDTGASYTMLSEDVLNELLADDPKISHVKGAVGYANMNAGDYEANATLARIPSMKWGDFELTNVGVVSRQSGIFEQWLTGAMSAPIVGALGGNALQKFCIAIDYAGQKLFIKPSSDLNCGNDLNQVGLVLLSNAGGDFTVKAVSAHADGEVRQNVHAGDQLLQVDGRDVAGLPMLDVVDALSGAPGDSRKLTLKQGKKVTEFNAKVVLII